jgi:DNA repair protein RadC
VEQKSRSEYNTRIRELPSSERPRERLRDLGARSLTTAELLAIVLRTGVGGQSVLSLADYLLKKHNGLAGLSRLSFTDLVHERGLGEAKAAELLATFQLAQRLNSLQPQERAVVGSPQDVYNFIGAQLAVLDQEELHVILLNTRNQVLGEQLVYKGSVNQSLVRAAEVLREAVKQNAPSIIVVHNHPSGDPQPSPDDVAMTKTVLEAGKLLDIELLDHVIIGDRQRWASLKQLGLGFAG